MSRIRLSQRQSYGLVAGVIGLALVSSGTPSPLYETYRELWGFSPVVLTLIYATYAFGVLAALLLAGSVSDRVGRRPVLLVSLAVLMGTTVIFMSAGSVAWLFVARGIQGVATGLALGAASAALLDLHPRRDPAGAGPHERRRQRRRHGHRRPAERDARPARPRAARPAVRRRPHPLHHRLPRRPGHAGARRAPQPADPHATAPARAARAAAHVRPGGARRPVVLVDRRPVPLARPRAERDALPQLEPPRRGRRRLRPRRLGRDRAARLRAHGAVARRGRRVGRARRRAAAHRHVGGRGLHRPVPRRRRGRRRGLRRRVPRGAADAVRRDPQRASRPGDVRAVRRRVPLDLGPGDHGRDPRDGARAHHDVRDLRQRRRGDRAARGLRGVDDPAESSRLRPSRAGASSRRRGPRSASSRRRRGTPG